MHTQYENQPFQVVRQLTNCSPAVRNHMPLQEKNDFNNLNSNFFRNNDHKYRPEKTERSKMDSAH